MLLLRSPSSSSSSSSSAVSLFFLSILYILPNFLTSAYTPLSDAFLRAIPHPGHALSPHNGSLLAPLLQPRVPGTPGQTAAQNHLASFFRTSLPHWNLTWQNSSATTPVSGAAKVPFANLIAKREPPWTKPGQANLLTLVAHYDSKYEPKGFVGATDSAAPCAMLMYVARVLDAYVTRMYDEMAELGEGGTVEMDMGVQILFLDGEEAFGKTWSEEDSLYGARALAHHWSTTPNPPSTKFHTYPTPLSQISLFLLLDLLGSPAPTVPSYFPTTHWAYQRLSTIERRMRALRLLESRPSTPFLPDSNGTRHAAGEKVADDHSPFAKRGVEVLHVIPDPFPEVWHTREDDGAHLEGEVVRDWARVVVGFALEWLDMMEVWDGERGIEGEDVVEG